MRLRLELGGRNLSEHADNVTAACEAHPTDLTVDPFAVAADDDPGRISRDLRADDLLSEDLLRAPAILGCDERREVPPAAVAHELPRSRVQPAHDARAVEHVARDRDRLERLLDVGVERFEAGWPAVCRSRDTGRRSSSTCFTSTSS